MLLQFPCKLLIDSRAVDRRASAIDNSQYEIDISRPLNGGRSGVCVYFVYVNISL